jgi:hypothetical protein
MTLDGFLGAVARSTQIYDERLRVVEEEDHALPWSLFLGPISEQTPISSPKMTESMRNEEYAIHNLFCETKRGSRLN